MRFWALILISVLALVGCGGGSPGSSGNPTQAPTANSPEQAMSWLSSDQRTALQNWRGSLVKSCEAADIFEGATHGDTYLDAGLLLDKLNHSLEIRGANGEFAYLGTMDGPTGTEDSNDNTQVDVNGATSSFSSEAVRNGDDCVVKAYGQTLYHLNLVGHSQIVAHFAQAKLADPKVATVNFDPNIVGDPTAEFEALPSSAFVSPVWSVLKPNDSTIPFVRDALGISADVANRIFYVMDGGLPLQSAVADPALSQLAPFAAGGDILGHSENLADYRQEGTWQRTFTWRVRPPQVTLGSESNSADANQDWLFTTSIRVQGSLAKGGKAAVLSLQGGDPAALSDEQATQCFASRFPARRSLAQADPYQLGYTFDEIASSCGVLSADLEGALLADNTAKTDVMSVFQRASDASFSYRDWGNILIDWAKRLYSQGADALMTLDPNGQVPFMPTADAQARYFLSQASTRPDLAPFKDAFVTMSYEWGLRNQQVDSTFAAEIADAIEKAGKPFPASTQSLIVAIYREPAAVKDSIDFASNLTTDYVAAAAATAQKATAVGLDSWNDDVQSKVLQNKTQLSQFTAWNATLDLASQFTQDDAKRTGKDRLDQHESNRKDLLEVAINEGWDASAFSTLNQIAPLAAHRSGCDLYSDYSSLINCVDPSHSLFSTHQGDLLDPAFQGRYGNLAAAFQQDWGTITALNDGTDMTFADAFWGASPLWADKNNTDFASNANQLADIVRQLAATSDFSQRAQLESQLQQLLH